MSRALAPLVLLALAALLGSGLAGCTSAGKESGGGDLRLADGSTVDLNGAAKDAPSSAGHGTVSGVVVDPGIRPIAGANVTVAGLGTVVRTDANGIFVVADLVPGLITLQVKAKGYLPVQTSAEVKAGETAKVRVVMDADLSPQPYHVTLKFKAHEDFGNGLADEAWDLFLANSTGPFPGLGKEPFCQCQFFFSADQQVTAFVFEAAWTDTVAKPGGTQCVPLVGCVTGPTNYYWELYDADSDFQKYASDSCTSPCHAVINGTTYDAKARHFWTAMYTDSNWVGYEQDYEILVSIFYNGEPPAGWSVINGDQ